MGRSEKKKSPYPVPFIAAVVLLYQVHLMKIKIHSSCEIEDFVETHICKLCVILQSRVLRVVCPQ